jgi:hypothetical protein
VLSCGRGNAGCKESQKAQKTESLFFVSCVLSCGKGNAGRKESQKAQKTESLFFVSCVLSCGKGNAGRKESQEAQEMTCFASFVLSCGKTRNAVPSAFHSASSPSSYRVRAANQRVRRSRE